MTVDDLIDRYAVILLDAFGVLMHSSAALSGAVDLIRKLNRIGKPFYILTNDASRLPSSSAERYQSFGLEIEPDRIITSGSLLSEYFAKHNLQGKPCAMLGPPDSVRYVEQAGGRVVAAAEDFEVLVIGDHSGTGHREKSNSALSTLLRQVDSRREVHLVLPNPDLVYPTGRGVAFASGSIALTFEAVLELLYPDRPDLRFARLGKPGAPMFAEAVRRSGTDDMVMIGDQLETDVRGARNFGIASALAGTGVTRTSHIPDDVRPDFLLPTLEHVG